MQLTKVAGVLLIGFLCSSACGDVLHVDDSALPGGDGLSWDSALRHLADAFDIAAEPGSPATEIRVAAGLYRPDAGANRILGDQSARFDLIDGLTLIGGFAGVLEPDPNHRDPSRFVSVLDGDLLNDDIFNEFNRVDNSDRVLVAQGISGAIVDGFLIRGAKLATDFRGAGLWCVDAEMTLIACHFYDNEAYNGGAVATEGASTLTILNSKFSSNRAVSGAAIFVFSQQTDLHIADCRFIVNEGETTGAVDSRGALLIERSDFVSNRSDNDGGAVALRSAGLLAARIVDCRFIDNWADERGGAIVNLGAAYIFERCVFRDNRSNLGGAVSHWLGQFLQPQSTLACTFINNRADDGGAVYVAVDSADFDSCLFVSNDADDGRGGAVAGGDGPWNFRNCTLIANTSTSGGHAIGVDVAIEVHNCIVRGSSLPSITPADAIVTHSNIEGGWPGTGNIDVDAQFADSAASNYRPMAGAPGIDFGDNQFVVTAFDRDGDPRIMDGDGDGTETTDLGANEYRFEDCDGNGVDDLVDVAAGAIDCNDNGILDHCESLPDCNGNGLDDACDVDAGAPDCNLNGIPDECELRGNDCNANGIPDDCDVFGEPEDCNYNGVPDACDIADGLEPDCNANGVPDICDFEFDCNNNGIPDSCDIEQGTSPDCNDNGVVDECEDPELDCNTNGIPDSCDVEQGTSPDCNNNGLPDECDIDSGAAADCNVNGIPDSCDVINGTSPDCNGNSIPDECDVDGGLSPDCNNNGIPDSCDLTNGTPDCNANGVPDSCDIVDETSTDVDTNGVPDECQDCNENGVFDPTDIATGYSLDCDGNNEPDECVAETVISLESGDIGPFGADVVASWAIPDAARAIDEVTLRLAASGDLSLEFEWIDLHLNGTFLARFFEDDGVDCPDEPAVASLTLSAATFNALHAPDVGAVWSVISPSTVDPNLCGGSQLMLQLDYRALDPDDLNHDGVPDICQCLADLDDSGSVGFLDLLVVLGAWGDCDLCPGDLNGDGLVGFDDLISLLQSWGPCL